MVGDEFVVLYELVVRAFGEKQRRHVERIDENPAVLAVGKQVLCVMMYDVVSAYEIHTLQEIGQFRFGCFVEYSSVVPPCTDVVHTVVLQ